MYYKFVDFFLNCRKALVTRTFISFTKSIKLKVLFKSR